MARLRNITTVVGFAGVPVGTVVPFAGSSAPTGWLFCDGSAISRTTYADLFTAINTIHGAGDGSTTFGIPDLRQRFILGKASSGTGNILGTTGGSIDHSHSIPAHYHAMGTGADLTIAGGNHTISLDHTHSAGTTGAGTAHTHGNGTLATGAGTAHTHGNGTIATDTHAGHAHDMSHGHTASSGFVSNDHTHNFTTGTESADHSHGFSGTTGGGNAMFYRLVANAGLGTNFNHMVGYSGGVFSDITDSNYNGSQHTHNFSGNTGGRSAAHTHSGTTGGINQNHNHAITVNGMSGNTGTAGSHSHSLSGSLATESAHTHPLTGAIASESAHTHSFTTPAFTGNSSSNGSHTHSSGNISGRIGLVTGGVDGNSGMSSSATNPPFYVLNHIIKH